MGLNDSSIYYSIIFYTATLRLITSFIILIIGIIFFGDIISNLEILGFILGVIAMILLFEKEKKNQRDYKKGIFLLLSGIFCLILGHTIVKVFSSQTDAIPTILVIIFLGSFTSSLIAGYKTIEKNKHVFLPIFGINLIQSILYFFYFVVMFYVYKVGDLGISYKIQSYSPFIPIILSAIIYKEKISKKKMIAILLTLISLGLFV